ncbi:hypothetical protein TRSC58_06385 [Trypanosoma rangeli SC58]|nr:hypothetical protein TRSC58_06385 [Trypanosoma rangeli SC58]
MEFHTERAVPFSAVVPPPPSIGTDIPVDPRSYRLKAYPFYDSPNPPEFVERLLKDRGVLPDTPAAAAGPSDDPAQGDGSAHYVGEK